MGKGRLRLNRQANPQQGDWGWFAGLVDGDGCISIQKQHGRYRASIIVVNRKPENILKLMRLFGGSTGKVDRNTASSYVNGVYYRWVISAHEDVKWCLNNCLDHLAEKRSKALLALEMCKLKEEYFSLDVRKYPKSISERMELIYQSSVAETECHPGLTTHATVRTHEMENHENQEEIPGRHL